MGNGLGLGLLVHSNPKGSRINTAANPSHRVRVRVRVRR